MMKKFDTKQNDQIIGGIYLGLGSNLGNRAESLITAKNMLNNPPKYKVLRLSSIYETEPWGVENQPPFLNAVIEIESSLNPHTLLEEIKNIEMEIGRTPTFHWGPRIIDIDILIFKNEIISIPDLVIPHPQIQNRLFVVAPLNELIPQYYLSTSSKTIAEIYKELIHIEQKVKLFNYTDAIYEKWKI